MWFSYSLDVFIQIFWLLHFDELKQILLTQDLEVIAKTN